MADFHFNCQLIEEVQQRPFIWNMQSDEYKKTGTTGRKRAWNDIGAKLKQPAESCKTRWTNLRSTFRKHMKKINDVARSGSGAEEVASRRKPLKQWDHFEAMKFLSDSTAFASSDSNLGAKHEQETETQVQMFNDTQQEEGHKDIFEDEDGTELGSHSPKDDYQLDHFDDTFMARTPSPTQDLSIQSGTSKRIALPLSSRKRAKTSKDIFMEKDIKVQEHRNQLLEALTLSSLAKKSSGSDERKMTPQAKWLLGYEEMLINAGEYEIKIRRQINEVFEKAYEEIKRGKHFSLYDD